jgi:PhnB protein
MPFSPYLFFSGNCREAFTRYQEIFGGQLDMMTMGDMPESEQPAPAEQADLIMHAAIAFGESLLMGSDDPTGDGGPKKGISVSYNVTDVDEAKRVFEALAEGGEIQMPMGPTFWAPAFGMCVDRFGIPWMVGADAPAAS